MLLNPSQILVSKAVQYEVVPVTMATMNIKFRKVELDGFNFLDLTFKTKEEQEIAIVMPSGESEEGAANDFPTVQQALESGETGNNSRSESERMEVFFLGTGVKNFTALEKTVKFAAVGTDPTIDNGFKDKISFALDRVPEGVVHIGQLHAAGSRINGKNQRCIKFISDDIPDPTKIFMFKNKRFVCEKIELQLDEKGIESVKSNRNISRIDNWKMSFFINVEMIVIRFSINFTGTINHVNHYCNITSSE